MYRERSRPLRLLGRGLAFVALAAILAAAWALAQERADASAPPNRAPVLAVVPDGASVRAGDRAVVVLEALDPDAAADGGTEAVWLGAGPVAGEPPAWLDATDWSAGPSERPRLELSFAPPFDAAPGSYAIEAGATDARGLTTLAAFAVTVPPPRCGAAAIEEDGACRECPEHRVPDAAREHCERCLPDTERPAGAPSCTDCPAGETSAAGTACGPAPLSLRTASRKAPAPPTGAAGGASARSPTTADTTPPTIAAATHAGTTVILTVSEPVWVEAPAAGNDFVVSADVVYRVTAVDVASRRADASATIALTLGKAIAGTAAAHLNYVPSNHANRRPRDAAGNRMEFHRVPVRPRRTLTVAFDGATGAGIAEDAGAVAVTLALDNPPAAGAYTGCGLRLAAGGVAGAADVAFAAADRALDAGNGWRVAGQLLSVVDDALAEGDEALAVEAFCTGNDAGTDPPAAGLASEPATVTLVDDESRTIVLSVQPDGVPEAAAATDVTVTATLDGAATAALELTLALSGTATADDYTVTGTQRIEIAAGARSGSTVLTIDPMADADADDESIVIGATPTGYAVTGATLTIAEPPPPPTIVVGADATTLSEAAGEVKLRLTLEHPPAGGAYTKCRLRLGAGGEAQTPADVTFPKVTKLVAEKGWTARTKLMTVVDDALAEGDETLVVEGHCTDAKPGTEPPPTALVSRPLTLTIVDNEPAAPTALTLSVRPDRIGESLGAQPVTVTAAVDTAPSTPVTVSLRLGSGAYAVSGARSVTIPAGATSGSTELTFTPTDDGNATDDAVAIGGGASGHAVTGTSLTIAEPVAVDGVDVSGLAVVLTVSPTAIREGASGEHAVRARLAGVNVPAVDVAMVLAVGGTATQGSSHDYTLTGKADWRELTVPANDAHLSANAKVTVAALADATDEGAETVTFTLGQVTWGTTVVALREPAVATLRITEAWEAPKAPKGLAAVPTPGNETHGLDAVWEAVTATPPVDGYVLRHREVANPPGAWNESDLQTGLAGALTGLHAGTRYELRVLARNAAGDGAESGGVFVRTADGDCPLAAPTVTTPTGARAYSDLEVGWTAPACGSTVASYRVRYREDPDVENVENGWTEIAAAGTGATVAGLTADTAYVVAVRAVATGGDKGPWSPPGKGRTGLDTRLPPRPGAPAVAPHGVDGASTLLATWTRVAWTDPDDAVRPVTEYQHRHRVEAGGDWTAATDARATAGETTTMTRPIAGLAVGAWHEVQVRAVNRMRGIAYPGKWSEPGRGRTWGAPDAVEEPAAYLTGVAVEVVWEAPHDGGSAITGYDVEYKLRDAAGWTPHPYGCTTTGCATETSIDAVAKKVRVRAENALGMGDWSPAATVRERKLLRVSYGRAAATVAEGESLLVTVKLDGAADRSVVAPVTTTGDATAFRLDGLGAADTVAFALNATEQTFAFVAEQDADDADEKITLGFGALPDGVRLTAPASLVATIRDDESANGRPTFDAGASATRAVAENAAAGTAVGLPLKASDPDGDALTYTLSGAHAGLFTVDAATGQLEVGAATELDFEGAVMRHAVTVEASDGKDGAGRADAAVDASIAVTVNVTDVAERPAAPDAPTLTPAADALAVAWTEPDNTGPAITGYDVHHRASGDPDWTDAGATGANTTATIGGLAAGTAHEVRVRATSDEGTSGWSASAKDNTLPAVSLTADAVRPEIAAGNAAVAATLRGTARTGGGGTLAGAWLERDGGGAVTVLADDVALTAGAAVTRAVSSSAPAARTFGFRATQTLDGRTRESTEWIGIEWRPTVILSAGPASVAEDGGATRVTVTATLTGTTLTSAAKTVDVSVAGGTATAGDDFEPVADFTIAIPGATRSAAGAFTLTPVADAAREGPETVAITGTASDGSAITVTGTTVGIADADPKLTVTAPKNGHVTGTTGGGDAAATVIDCGSGGRTDCAATLAAGTVVTLTATADAKHLFTGWTGACGGSADCTVTLNADRTVGAGFVAARNLIVTAPTHGRVTGRLGTKTVIDCGTNCSATVADGATVALRASAADDHRFDAWGGACAEETAADCAVTLDADRAVSVVFVSTAVVGKCDESVVDGCASGTLNDTAFSDTDSHHRWRCDGSGGGANSPECSKAKSNCSAGNRDWNVGDNACRGSVTGAASGQTRTASDGNGSTTGSASFKCDDGKWAEQAGSVCGLECAADASRFWRDGTDLCSARLPTTRHLGTRTVTDGSYPATGSATYQCNDGAWEGPSASTCRAGCAGETRSNCKLVDTVDGGRSGTCDAKSTGNCSYSCSDGIWSWESGRCNAGCPASTEDWKVGDDACQGKVTKGAHGASRKAVDASGSEQGSATFMCSSGNWLEQSGSTCASQCTGQSKTWNDGSDTCEAPLATTPHGETGTAKDTTYKDTGSATYSCSDGTWSETPTSKTCHAGCAGTTMAGCPLSNKIHGGEHKGSCGTGYSGECTYSCDDGAWIAERACVPDDCPEESKSWSDDDENNHCSATLAEGKHGKEGTAKDRAYSATGSATYQCHAGTWTEPPTSKTCYAGCAGETIAGCELSDTVHDDTDKGSCGTGYSGSCSYSCSNGEWMPESTCTRIPDNCASESKSWSVGDNDCSAEVADGMHGSPGTATDDDYSGTGSATYACNDGRWTEPPTSKTCHAGCAGTTIAGCKLTNTVHGSEPEGVCQETDLYTGSCSYSCGNGTWTAKTECTPPRTVTVSPEPKGATVAGEGINCPGDCSTQEKNGTPYTLTATPKTDYDCKSLTVKGGSELNCENSETCTFKVTSDVTASIECKRLELEAEAGGPYDVTRILLPQVPIPTANPHTVTVMATATGGEPPYTFKWSNKDTFGARVVYLWPALTPVPSKVTVKVTDEATPTAGKDTDTAILRLPSANGIQGASDASAAFEVPLGGELQFIWGGDDTVKARSESAAVVTVSVSSPVIIVTGTGVGETHVIVTTDDGDWWLPVVVR